MEAAQELLRNSSHELTTRWKQCADYFVPSSWSESLRDGLQWDPKRIALVPPTTSSTQPRRGIRRKLTWEDTINVSRCCTAIYLPYQNHPHKVHAPVSLFGIHAPSVLDWPSRQGGVCRNMWYCTSWPAPLAIRTTHRPASAVLARVKPDPKQPAGRGPSRPPAAAWLGLLTPKVGTSSLIQFASALGGVRGSRVAALSWQSAEVLGSAGCANASYSAVVHQMAAAAAAAAVAAGKGEKAGRDEEGHGASADTSTLLTGCGHASTFDLGFDLGDRVGSSRRWRGGSRRGEPAPAPGGGTATVPDPEPPPPFAFAMVRDPVSRFISALNPHGSTSDTKPSEATLVAYDMGYAPWSASAANLSVLDLLAMRARRMLEHPHKGHVDDAHTRTQSYYLSATNARGDPIEWDAMLRLEDSSTHAATLAIALGVPPPEQSASEPPGARGGAAGRPLPRPAIQPFAASFNSKSEACRPAPIWWRISRVCAPRQLDSQRAAASAASGGSGTAPSGGVASSSASVLRAAVLRHPTLACDLCSIYGQDFDCLGYRFPEKCAEPACLARLPPPLARSVRQAQQAGMLEQTPQA